jgi:hypothetical protein
VFAEADRPPEEVVPRVRTERVRLLDHPLGSWPDAGRVTYRVEWELSAPDGRAGTAGEEMAVAWVMVVAPGTGTGAGTEPDGDERLVARRILSVAWYTARDPRLDISSLRYLDDDGAQMPGPLADAIAELLAADKAAVPECRYCAMTWELGLLAAADRLWDEADRHGNAEVIEALTPWVPTTDDRDTVRPCPCGRGRTRIAWPESAHHHRPAPPDAAEEDAVRHRLAAARRRHLARRGAGGDVADSPPG